MSPGGRGGDRYTTDVSPRKLHGRIPVDIGQQAQAEALRVGGVSEAIYCHGWL